MNIAGSIALDALSMVYMLVLILNLGHNNRREPLGRQYVQIMAAVCVFLALDIAYLLLYGKTGAAARLILKTVKSLYFIANCALLRMWAEYVECILFGFRRGSRKWRAFYTGVFAVNSAAVVVNFFTGFLFQISPEGTFIVGYAAMWTFTALNYLTVLLVTATIVRHRREIQHNVFLQLAMFALPPLCGEIIQLFYRPISLVGTYAVSALLIFQTSQNNVIYTDELTGLANRRMLNEHLNKWFSEAKGATVCGIMIDLDGLKRINDTRGHLAGDAAIIRLADIIKSVGREDIVCARYGGDEFVLAWVSAGDGDEAEVMRRLEENRVRFNRLRPAEEAVEFSMGSYCCRGGGPSAAADFLRQMDASMYRIKKGKRADGGGKTARP